MMKKLLWDTLLAACILTMHHDLSSMESMKSQKRSFQDYYFYKEQPSNKLAKLKLSTDEQHKINASLIEAVVNNDIQKAVNCLKSGATIYRNCIDSRDANMQDYLTPEIIQKANDNNYLDISNAFDPLALAAKFGSIDMIKAIINYIPKDKFQDVLGDALLAALLNNNIETIKFLISRKTSSYYCGYGYAPILSFIKNTTSTQALSLILEDVYADDIDDMDPNGYTGLWCAASCGNTAAVKLLLARGASLRAYEELKNDRYYDRGNHNALQAALTNNHPDTALCILKHFMPSHDLYPADVYKKLNIDDVQSLLESMSSLKLDEQCNTVVHQFKSSTIFVNNYATTSNPEQYDTSPITDLEKKNLLNALLDPKTPDNHPCYQKLFAMNLWDDANKKSDAIASKQTYNDNTVLPNHGKQEK